MDSSFWVYGSRSVAMLTGIKLGPHKTTCLRRSTEALGCHIENHTVTISNEKAAAIATCRRGQPDVADGNHAVAV